MDQNVMTRRLQTGAFSATLSIVSTICGVAGSSHAAAAHPHVWVEVQTEIIYGNGSFAGVKQVWTFDELYTAQAIEGLDKNKDGRLDRGELAELAQVNMEGLKEFDYFTFAKLGSQRLTFGAPSEAYLDHVEVKAPPGPKTEPDAGASPPQTPTPGAGRGAGAPPPPQASGPQASSDGFWGRAWNSILGKSPPSNGTELPRVLTLTFTIPFTQPVLADAAGFEVSTYDPSFFIWLDLAPDGAKMSSTAPAGCKLELVDATANAGEAQKLGEAFFNQMGGAAFGATSAKTISARCQTS